MYEKQFFRCRVSQSEISEPLPPPVITLSTDTLPIRLKLFKLIGSLHPPNIILYDVPNLITEPQMLVSLTRAKLSRLTKRGYAKVMARHLSKMGIPDAEQHAIIGKVFEVVQVAVPQLPITVIIADVTVTTQDEPSLCKLTRWVDVGRREMLDVYGLLWEFMESYRVDDIRRHTEAVVKHDLKLVKLDGLEAGVRQTLCFVCKEKLDRGVGYPNRVAQLHCSHFYHLGCIVRWRTESHLCPTCQHPVVEEPPKSYGRFHWDMRYASREIDEGDGLNQMIRRVIEKIKPDDFRKIANILKPSDSNV